MSKQKKLRRVHRRRRRWAGRSILIVMVGLLFVVSISAMVIMLYFYATDMIPVFAGADTATEVPAWIGNLPEDAPQIGSAVPEPTIDSNIWQPIPPGQEVFAQFPFYISANAEYYEEFHQRYPHLDPETIVWKVNAFLHLPFYSYVRVNTDPNPLLVNPSHRLPYGFTPAILVPVYDGNLDMTATPATAAAFRRLRASAQQEGFDLAVVSAYRPATRQYYLFHRRGGTDGVVARPYHSEHQTGRALDLWGPGPSGLMDATGPRTPVGLWVEENAHNYGFIVRYTEYNTHITGFISEPWHITYVTLEVAQNIHQNSLSSLEEFVARNPSFRLPG